MIHCIQYHGFDVHYLFLSKVGQETAARDGLMKMKQVYESNPALGDPMSIQGQLTENGHKLDKLRAELKKFQVGICTTSSSHSSHSTEFFVVRHSK